MVVLLGTLSKLLTPALATGFLALGIWLGMRLLELGNLVKARLSVRDAGYKPLPDSELPRAKLMPMLELMRRYFKTHE